MNKLLSSFQKLPNIAKFIALAVVLLALCVVEYKFFIAPRKANIVENKVKVDALEKDYKESQEIADNLETFMAEVTLLDEELKRALALLPDKEDIQGILRSVSKEAKKTNIKLITFKPESRNASGFYSSITMSLVFEGDFHDIAKFIDRIGKLRRIINVSDIVFDVPSNSKASVLKVNAKATTYMFGAPK